MTDPPIINVVARAGGVTINGGHLVLDEWNLMGTKYDVTSGLVVISREAADVGRIAIQATGDVRITRDVSGLNLNRQNFAAVATVVNSSGPIGGEVQVRSLAGRIVVRDRAVQADGKGANGAAVTELVADRDIEVESPMTGDAQHRPTLPTAATAFLYRGPDPIQTGVALGSIEPQRVAVVRGQVLDHNGTPLSGVTVSVLTHPAYGQTLTRSDGWFDLRIMHAFFLAHTKEQPRSGVSIAVVLITKEPARLNDYWEGVLYPYSYLSPSEVPTEWLFLSYDVALLHE
jgi:hypothetical protein